MLLLPVFSALILTVGCRTNNSSGNSDCCYLKGPSKYASSIIFKIFLFSLGLASASSLIYKLCRLIKWVVLLMSWIQFSSRLRRPPSLWRRSVGRLVDYLPPKFNLYSIFAFLFINQTLIVFQVATDKCIMLFLFLIVCGVIAIIIVKVFSPIHPFIALNFF